MFRSVFGIGCRSPVYLFMLIPVYRVWWSTRSVSTVNFIILDDQQN